MEPSAMVAVGGFVPFLGAASEELATVVSVSGSSRARVMNVGEEPLMLGFRVAANASWPSAPLAMDTTGLSYEPWTMSW
jgi:hypothetical protein